MLHTWNLYEKSLNCRTHPGDFVLNASSGLLSFFLLSRSLDVGQPVRSDRWIRQAGIVLGKAHEHQQCGGKGLYGNY